MTVREKWEGLVMRKCVRERRKGRREESGRWGERKADRYPDRQTSRQTDIQNLNAADHQARGARWSFRMI